MNRFIIKENDLVKIRIDNYHDTWWRVKFVDNDNSFVGILEKREWNPTIQLYSKGHQKKFYIDEVLQIYNGKDEFCYSDNVTICTCPGLCKNK